MSLAIDTDKVTHVLLTDGWHEVANGSFDIDSFEFVHGDHLVHGGGNSGVCASGFCFVTTDGRQMFGPLTAILGVSISPKEKTKKQQKTFAAFIRQNAERFRGRDWKRIADANIGSLDELLEWGRNDNPTWFREYNLINDGKSGAEVLERAWGDFMRWART